MNFSKPAAEQYSLFS